ncbi:hypothetical protein [Ruegeria sp. HKCCSP346]|uniref:hypothetical protein n=1 Tax=Ruegeria sp. HKCCSP346 TaxID=2794830 RepID=UPI0032AF8A5B
MKVLAVREHGMFQPETGSVTLDGAHISPERFFDRPEQIVPAQPWLEALRNRQLDLVFLGVFLAALLAV